MTSDMDTSTESETSSHSRCPAPPPPRLEDIQKNFGKAHNSHECRVGMPRRPPETAWNAHGPRTSSIHPGGEQRAKKNALAIEGQLVGQENLNKLRKPIRSTPGGGPAH
ncbi:hypothetical protein TNCV_339401 [Trichonephila clavipes]|nr:hypothetical protein TNCV_339401 [Trichonephila clavipes]